jgi:hypothetical protein
MFHTDEDQTGDLNEKIMSVVSRLRWLEADHELKQSFYSLSEGDDWRENRKRLRKLERAGLIRQFRRSTLNPEALKKLLSEVKGKEVRWIDDSDDGFVLVTLLVGDRKLLESEFVKIKNRPLNKAERAKAWATIANEAKELWKLASRQKDAYMDGIDLSVRIDKLNEQRERLKRC